MINYNNNNNNNNKNNNNNNNNNNNAGDAQRIFTWGSGSWEHLKNPNSQSAWNARENWNPNYFFFTSP